MLSLALLLMAQPAGPKSYPPDERTAARIAALRAELDGKLSDPELTDHPDCRHDIAVYAKAAEWAVRHGEWLTKDTAAQTVRVLEAGLARADRPDRLGRPWRRQPGRTHVRGYRSGIDGSVQPVRVSLPAGFDPDADKRWPVDVVLHGRDATLTEVKFLAAAEASKPGSAAPDRIVLEPFGRGNLGYRWAAENDLTEAALLLQQTYRAPCLDGRRAVLRGFSMGGAGVWHYGLHHPFAFAALQPGAGFTTTRGYVPLPDPLPDHVAKCLRIYDAADYAANITGLPVVAYSGEKDKQKAAADAVAAAAAKLPGPVPFTHVVAPGLEHKQPPEWIKRCDAELAKHLPRPDLQRTHFTTYTPRYGDAGFARVEALERLYEPATVDIDWAADGPTVRTTNVRVLRLRPTGPITALIQSVVPEGMATDTIRIDGQRLAWPAGTDEPFLVKTAGKWAITEAADWYKQPRLPKHARRQGPIDDAFNEAFACVAPTEAGWHPAATRAARDRLEQFGREWDGFFRGKLPMTTSATAQPETHPGTLVLFGDPGSNPFIAKALPKLPITWTRDALVVNGVRYDPATHYPVLIFPSPWNPRGQVVLNSGHTFGEADFRGSNAQLYPRLGDWAVLRTTGDVVAGGLFDADWRFEK